MVERLEELLVNPGICGRMKSVAAILASCFGRGSRRHSLSLPKYAAADANQVDPLYLKTIFIMNELTLPQPESWHGP